MVPPLTGWVAHWQSIHVQEWLRVVGFRLRSIYLDLAFEIKEVDRNTITVRQEDRLDSRPHLAFSCHLPIEIEWGVTCVSLRRPSEVCKCHSAVLSIDAWVCKQPVCRRVLNAEPLGALPERRPSIVAALK